MAPDDLLMAGMVRLSFSRIMYPVVNRLLREQFCLQASCLSMRGKGGDEGGRGDLC